MGAATTPRRRSPPAPPRTGARRTTAPTPYGRNDSSRPVGEEQRSLRRGWRQEPAKLLEPLDAIGLPFEPRAITVRPTRARQDEGPRPDNPPLLLAKRHCSPVAERPRDDLRRLLPVERDPRWLISIDLLDEASHVVVRSQAAVTARAFFARSVSPTPKSSTRWSVDGNSGSAVIRAR